MSKVERITRSILVFVASILIIIGYSFFDEVHSLIALGVGLISGQLISVIITLKEGGEHR